MTVFFFKQKTAYEMRISDWSSDVCSSDLLTAQVLRVPGTSIDQSQAMQSRIERELGKLPEVRFVFSKTGTAELAADPMPPNISDTFIIIKPRDEWPDSGLSKSDL